MSNTIESNIQVAIRIRPLLDKEIKRKDFEVTVVEDNLIRIFDPVDVKFENENKTKIDLYHRSREQRFTFDNVFYKQISSTEIYQRTAQQLVDPFYKGFNGCIFAYGATGTGKTHTMLGNDENAGLISLTLQEIFQRKKQIENFATVQVKALYVEIYNENIRDLLKPNNKQYCHLRDHPTKGVNISGCLRIDVESSGQVMDLLYKGNKRRATEETNANLTSSRSHAIFQIYLNIVQVVDNKEEKIQSKLSLIDLAGSERGTVTQNKGIRLREGAKINQSLLSLANCINALGQRGKKGQFIPYRDSKLTRMLKDSLGGNSLTFMVVTISPSSSQFEETVNTLKYANRAKNIKSKVVENKKLVEIHISEYYNVIKELKQEIQHLKQNLRIPFNENLDDQCQNCQQNYKQNAQQERITMNIVQKNYQEYFQMQQQIRTQEESLYFCNQKQQDEKQEFLKQMKQKQQASQLQIQNQIQQSLKNIEDQQFKETLKLKIQNEKLEMENQTLNLDLMVEENAYQKLVQQIKHLKQVLDQNQKEVSNKDHLNESILVENIVNNDQQEQNENMTQLNIEESVVLNQISNQTEQEIDTNEKNLNSKRSFSKRFNKKRRLRSSSRQIIESQQELSKVQQDIQGVVNVVNSIRFKSRDKSFNKIKKPILKKPTPKFNSKFSQLIYFINNTQIHQQFKTMIKQEDLIFLENWMSLSTHSIANIKLKNLVLVGSHDANTQSLNKPKVALQYAICQELSLTEQMKLGVRYLDLRFSQDKLNVLVDAHAIFTGDEFLPKIIEIHDFIESHQGEFFIIQLQNENNIEELQLQNLFTNIQKHLNQYMITKQDFDSWFDLKKVKMRQIFEHKKQLLFFVSNKLLENSVVENLIKDTNIFKQDEIIVNNWHNQNNKVLLFKELLDDLDQRHLYKDKLFVSQIIMSTPKLKFLEKWIQMLVQYDKPTIKNFVERLFFENSIYDFINLNIDKKFNILLLDLINYDIQFVLLTLCMNLKNKINILYFGCGEVNLTKDVKTRLDNRAYIFFKDINNILQKNNSKYKQLVLIYQYKNCPVRVEITSLKQNQLLVYNNPVYRDKESFFNYCYILYKKGKIKAKYSKDKNSIKEYRSVKKAFVVDLKNGQIEELL